MSEERDENMEMYHKVLQEKLQHVFATHLSGIVLCALEKIFPQTQVCNHPADIEAIIEGFRQAQIHTDQELARLTAAQIRNDEQMARLSAAQSLTEDRLARLEERLTRLETAITILRRAQIYTEERLNRIEAAVKKLKEKQTRTEDLSEN
jgi:hypothetical protein